MMNLAENKERIYTQVAKAAQLADRSIEDVTVIAVTKSVTPEIAADLVATGVKHVAENRVDKFLEKYDVLKNEGLTWHLIGSLQRRKVKSVINSVDYFHALDSVTLAAEIQKRAEHPINCFLQVNISGEESKHGFHEAELAEAFEAISHYDKIRVVGLMTMAPLDASEAEIDAIFAKTNAVRKLWQSKQIPNMPLTELSMGMSGDYQLAIKNGATFVRIGTAFFK